MTPDAMTSTLNERIDLKFGQHTDFLGSRIIRLSVLAGGQPTER